MKWRVWTVMALAMVSTTIPLSTTTAQTGVAATLSVLSEPVERIPAGSGAAEAGISGMNLVEGDRVYERSTAASTRRRLGRRTARGWRSSKTREPSGCSTRTRARAPNSPRISPRTW